MGNEMSQEYPVFDDSVLPRTLTKRSVSAVADYIRSGHVSKVVFMVGAGISTSAGIPDFRSPDTGLYANLAKLNLPYPEAVFDLGYFRKNPLPFYTLAKELYPGSIRPTVAHYFMKLLCDKGLVSKIFTQNIDGLERQAGIPPHLIVEAHGSFTTHSCIECGSDYPDALMKRNIENIEIPHCLRPRCKGLVKPDIVFFSESLPQRFFKERFAVSEADLLIIMGTSLSVHPFAGLPHLAVEKTPRVLVNLERVGGIGNRLDDFVMLEGCDQGVRKLAKALGWGDELEALWEATNPNKKLDKGKAKETVYDGPMDMDEVLRSQVESLTRDVERGLSLAEKHRAYVGHQLKQEEERRKKGDDMSRRTSIHSTTTSLGGQVQPQPQPQPATQGETPEKLKEEAVTGGPSPELLHIVEKEKEIMAEDDKQTRAVPVPIIEQTKPTGSELPVTPLEEVAVTPPEPTAAVDTSSSKSTAEPPVVQDERKPESTV